MFLCVHAVTCTWGRACADVHAVTCTLLFRQATEALTALQKTSQQVQNLAQLVKKHATIIPSVLSAVHAPSQSGESTDRT